VSNELLCRKTSRHSLTKVSQPATTTHLASLAAAVRTRAAFTGVRAAGSVVAAAARTQAASAAAASIRAFGASTRHDDRLLLAWFDRSFATRLPT